MVIMTGSRVLLRFSANSVIYISIFHVYHYIRQDAMFCCIEQFPIIIFQQQVTSPTKIRQLPTSKLRGHSPHNDKREAAENPGMCLQGGHPNMRTETLRNAREELLNLGLEGAKGGETKWDEVEASCGIM